MADDTVVLSSAALSASYTMIIQLTFRILTFILNGVMLRYISRELLGVVNVRLTLLYTTVQFLATEPFIRACLSKTADGKRVWHQIINLVWYSVPVGVIISLVFGSVWIFMLERPDEERVPHYTLAVVCYCISAIIETLAQPLHVITQLLLHVRLKTFIDGAALTTRCITTVSFVVFQPDWGVLSFCIAQLLYSSIIAASYYSFYIFKVSPKQIHKHSESIDYPITCIRDLFPRRKAGFVSINIEQARLVWSFAKQSFLKQILTEGERYLMTIFGILSFPDQGVYDIINNLGSLVARFIFLPVEDGFYLFVTQTTLRGQKAVNQVHESIHLVSHLLETLLRAMLFIGLIFVTFGYSYSFLLLDLYGGSTLSSSWGPTLLRWYCLYVLVISLNGVTEGFKNATMSVIQVDRYNHMMVYFAVFFLFSAYALTSLFGSIGFILANCFNMSARIVHSLVYMQNFFDGYDRKLLMSLVLSRSEVFAFIGAAIATAFSEALFCCNAGLMLRIVHVGVGGISFCSVLLVIWFNERKMITFIREQYKMIRKGRPIESKSN